MQGSNRGQPSASPPQQLLLLAGGGHSHALLLRQWAMDPARRPAGTLISLVNRTSTALYSGMVPGLVAGLYQRPECAIDLRRLCGLAGVSFIQAEIISLDLGRRQLGLAGRPPLAFDTLSLDVGALTAAGETADDCNVAGCQALAVKPLEPFLAWSGALEPGSIVRIRGGGAAAVELALALRCRGVASRLLLRGDALHFDSRAARRSLERLLAEAGIPVERHGSAQAGADLACTGSRAPAWLAAAGLPVQRSSGRVLTERTLAVIGHPHLFAVGDCGLIAASPRPAAGVWAVRAAPVLATNLQRQLQTPGASLQAWMPQAWALQLLGVGGAAAAASEPGALRALALWGPLVLGPYRWLWHWKQWIDRRFMARFHDLGVDADTTAADPRAPAMACRGCGAKLAAQPLVAALARLDPGGQAPPAEDAAVLGLAAEGDLLLQSLDGFPALVEDPWLNARLTTLHACSDLWACGATVQSVQALVTVPQAAAPLQEELLLQTLAGLRSVLEPLGAALIGGHTLEARDGAGLALALTVNGRVAPGQHWSKGPLRRGDVLLLSRPLGSGVLFAAAMAGAAEPQWIDTALAVMQRSQAELVPLFAAHRVGGCTDVTGFGLLGHLGEMLAASPGVGVELDLEAIPALPGALALLQRGFASSLAPANASALALLEGPVRLAAASTAEPQHLGLLLDPQTCGPLLAALPAERAAAALLDLRAAGFAEAVVIAKVVAGQAA